MKEFLLEANEAERLAPETFNMESLLHQMSEIDEMYHRPSPSGMENLSILHLKKISLVFCLLFSL